MLVWQPAALLFTCIMLLLVILVANKMMMMMMMMIQSPTYSAPCYVLDTPKYHSYATGSSSSPAEGS